MRGVSLLLDSHLLDSALVRAFRLRTRGFLRMDEMAEDMPAAPRGGDCHLYVHIPFCAALCPFCSFHRVQHCPTEARRYFAALREEIQLYHRAGFVFSSAYFGGGTPTIEPGELLETIALARRLFPLREISVETNPRELRPELIARLRDAGVTRLSVGVQSFDDDLLRRMGRYEKYGGGDEAAECIRRAAGSFPTLNVDLIFNQPTQSLESLRRDLRIFRTLGANQVSCYPLMSAPGVLRRMTEAMGAPDRRRLRPFYQAIVRALAPEYQPTSAWCFTRQGHASDEYIIAAENYVGVGSGAFSYLDGVLYATTFSLSAYARRISGGHTGVVTRHELNAGDRMRYSLLVWMFGLGFDHERARRRFGPAFHRRLRAELWTLRTLGAARRDDRGYRLTGRGQYWLMLMMAEFFEAVNAYRDAMRAHVHRETAEREPAGRYRYLLGSGSSSGLPS